MRSFFKNPDEFRDLLVYTHIMKKKSLIETNPYLKDPRERWERFITATTSSSAVEDIHIDSKDILDEYEKRVGAISPSEAKRLSRLGR